MPVYVMYMVGHIYHAPDIVYVCAFDRLPWSDEEITASIATP